MPSITLKLLSRAYTWEGRERYSTAGEQVESLLEHRAQAGDSLVLHSGAHSYLLAPDVEQSWNSLWLHSLLNKPCTVADKRRA